VILNKNEERRIVKIKKAPEREETGAKRVYLNNGSIKNAMSISN